jgi:hypothetical protein
MGFCEISSAKALKRIIDNIPDAKSSRGKVGRDR